MEEIFVKSKNLELFTQVYGKATNPAVILIYGAAGQGILWDQDLCKNIANNGYFVIRFDNRDTGKSSAFDYNANPYNLKDMAQDIIIILDYFKIHKAHIVGSSMGGYIAQNLAIYFPSRILTLTLMMTTINSLALRGVRGICNLPGANIEVIKKISQLYKVPRSSLEDKINVLLQTWELFNGNMACFPLEQWRELAIESYQRATSKNAVRNHRLAVLNSKADRTKDLQALEIATLIIHGEEDPIIQVPHAHYANKNIPGSSTVIIKKMGHLLTSVFTNQIEDELLRHFEKKSY
ncbi:MAG: alpha/beta hydrolase [Rickettsiales bacterium]